MSRVYTVPYQGTITAAGTDADLLYLLPAAGKRCVLRGMIISNFSDFGDAQEEGVRISIIRLPATVTAGSGGSTVTGAVVDQNNGTAAGFTAHCNDTTVATTSGTALTIEEFGWNIRNTPFERWWPEDRYASDVINASALVVRMQSTLADDVSMAFTFWVEES